MTIPPTKAALIAATRTLAAARSFTFLMESCQFGETKSAILSKEVLINSAEITNPIAKTIAIHSNAEILTRSPSETARMDAPK